MINLMLQFFPTKIYLVCSEMTNTRKHTVALSKIKRFEADRDFQISVPRLSERSKKTP